MSAIEQKTFPSYAFGPFVLNGTERLLLRGDEVVALTPKVLETLFVLVENHGRVLTKNVLMEALWPDCFVEESSLTQNISLLRKALGYGQPDQVYIETIPKRGYRFVAPVAEVKDEGPTNLSHPTRTARLATPTALRRRGPRAETPVSLSSDFDKLTLVGHPTNKAPESLRHVELREDPTVPRVPRRLRWQTVVAVCCLIAVSTGIFYWWRIGSARRNQGVAPKSVAVLPFKTVGANGETELIGLGMADSVILRLSKVEQVRVLPTSAVFKYTGGERNALSIGRELGVDAVLDGTVQRWGDQVRVTAQLITLKDGKTIWSGQFDEKYRDIFCLQDSVAELLSGDLRLQVLNMQAKSESRPITRNAEAYQAYLKGLYFWNQRSKETLPEAIDYLQQAVDKDENFAIAHALLADSYHISPGILRSNPEQAAAARQKAETAAMRAIALDETLAEAHTVMAGILANRGDGDGAAKEYRRALLLNPSYATAHVRYAHFLFARLDLDGALRETKQAQTLDPMSPVTNAALGYMLMMNRQWEGSIPYLQRSLELNPDATQSRISLGLAYLHCGRSDEALTEFSKVADQDPVSSQMNLALTYAKLGRRDEAHKLVGEVLRSADRYQASNYDLVTIYFALGEKERGFELLRKSQLSWRERALLKLDPELDNVRSEPKFEAIVKKQIYPEQSS